MEATPLLVWPVINVSLLQALTYGLFGLTVHQARGLVTGNKMAA